VQVVHQHVWQSRGAGNPWAFCSKLSPPLASVLEKGGHWCSEGASSGVGHHRQRWASVAGGCCGPHKVTERYGRQSTLLLSQEQVHSRPARRQRDFLYKLDACTSLLESGSEIESRYLAERPPSTKSAPSGPCRACGNSCRRPRMQPSGWPGSCGASTMSSQKYSHSGIVQGTP
jgi:hypothetical protein